MPIPQPRDTESQDEFISRCMSDEKMKSEYTDEAQRYAVCAGQFAAEKVSFDWDGTGSTKKGKEMIQEYLDKGADVYIITARSSKAGISFPGIDADHIIATGSNKAKVEKIKELGISKHYDNNEKVIAELGSLGVLFRTN
jgi:hypothetical protein